MTLPPIVLTVGVTSLANSSVTLVGSINTRTLSGSWWFEWGTTPALGTSTASGGVASGGVPSAGVASAGVPIAVQTPLVGLTPATPYYFALVGESSAGQIDGTTMVFTTSGVTPTTVGGVAPATTPSSVTLPHFAWPFRLRTGTVHIQYGTQVTSNDGAYVVEQDSDGDVFACVAAIMECTVGEWPEAPAFGIPDMVFQQGLDTLGLASTVSRWEPRASTDIVSSIAAGVLGEEGQYNVGVAVQARST